MTGREPLHGAGDANSGSVGRNLQQRMRASVAMIAPVIVPRVVWIPWLIWIGLLVVAGVASSRAVTAISGFNADLTRFESLRGVVALLKYVLPAMLLIIVDWTLLRSERAVRRDRMLLLVMPFIAFAALSLVDWWVLGDAYHSYRLRTGGFAAEFSGVGFYMLFAYPIAIALTVVNAAVLRATQRRRVRG